MLRAVCALLVAANAIAVAPCAAETWVRHVDTKDGYQLDYPADMFQPGRRDFFGVTMDALVDTREFDDPTRIPEFDDTIHIFIIFEPEEGLSPAETYQRLLDRVEPDQVIFDRSTDEVVDLALFGGFGLTVQYYFHGSGGVMTAYREVDRASHEALLRRIGQTLRPIDSANPDAGK